MFTHSILKLAHVSAETEVSKSFSCADVKSAIDVISTTGDAAEFKDRQLTAWPKLVNLAVTKKMLYDANKLMIKLDRKETGTNVTTKLLAMMDELMKTNELFDKTAKINVVGNCLNKLLEAIVMLSQLPNHEEYPEIKTVFAQRGQLLAACIECIYAQIEEDFSSATMVAKGEESEEP